MGTKSLKYSALIPVLTKAVQALSLQNNLQQKQIEELRHVTGLTTNKASLEGALFWLLLGVLFGAGILRLSMRANQKAG